MNLTVENFHPGQRVERVYIDLQGSRVIRRGVVTGRAGSRVLVVWDAIPRRTGDYSLGELRRLVPILDSADSALDVNVAGLPIRLAAGFSWIGPKGGLVFVAAPFIENCRVDVRVVIDGKPGQKGVSAPVDAPLPFLKWTPELLEHAAKVCELERRCALEAAEGYVKMGEHTERELNERHALAQLRLARTYGFRAWLFDVCARHAMSTDAQCSDRQRAASGVDADTVAIDRGDGSGRTSTIPGAHAHAIMAGSTERTWRDYR